MAGAAFLNEYLPQPTRRQQFIEILKEEAVREGVNPAMALTVRGRDMRYVLMRWRAWYRGFHELGMSKVRLGQLMGYDHSTVSYGVRKLQELIDAGVEEKITIKTKAVLRGSSFMTYTLQVNATLGAAYARGDEKYPGSENSSKLDAA